MNKMDSHYNLDSKIAAVLHSDAKPSSSLNNSLKHTIREVESKREVTYNTKPITPGNALQQNYENYRKMSLWYVPMLLNFIFFVLLAILAQIMIPIALISKIVLGSCIYFAFMGIILTIWGLRHSNLKYELVVYFKGGNTI